MNKERFQEVFHFQYTASKICGTCVSVKLGKNNAVYCGNNLLNTLMLVRWTSTCDLHQLNNETNNETNQPQMKGEAQ